MSRLRKIQNRELVIAKSNKLSLYIAKWGTFDLCTEIFLLYRSGIHRGQWT